MLGNQGVTESNMMQYLGIIEQKTSEILQTYAASQANVMQKTGGELGIIQHPAPRLQVMPPAWEDFSSDDESEPEVGLPSNQPPATPFTRPPPGQCYFDLSLSPLVARLPFASIVPPLSFYPLERPGLTAHACLALPDRLQDNERPLTREELQRKTLRGMGKKEVKPTDIPDRSSSVRALFFS